jgi:hypothetical protein
VEDSTGSLVSGTVTESGGVVEVFTVSADFFSQLTAKRTMNADKMKFFIGEFNIFLDEFLENYKN